jgi:hypothetical protein
MELTVNDLKRALRSRLWVIVGVSGFCLAPAQADDFQITLLPTTTNINAGSSGSFEVLLTDEIGGAGVTIGAFNFALKSTSTDVTFTDANDSTTATGYMATSYIFSGNSLADAFFGGDLTIQTSPELIGTDFAYIPGSGTTMTGGETLALGEVLFDVSPTAPTETVDISFDESPAGTALSDPSDNNIPIASFTGATINITGGTTSMPEPSFFLILVGVMLLFLPILRMLHLTRKTN